jgi:hypothetical protein
MQSLLLPLLLLIGSLALCSCAAPLRSQAPPKWATGFWFWDGSSASASGSVEPLDVLFVQAGTINQPTRHGSSEWSVYGNIPRDLPAAREFWLVFRFERQQMPDLSAISALATKFATLREQARQDHRKVAGIQLDIDCPTGSLAQYAVFLNKLRSELPPNSEISITALLDWFRDGTAIADVIKETDEFVPQFYDVGASRRTIAVKFDGTKWGRTFNRFQKRFRIGIATFGRAQIASPLPTFFRDLTPLDVASDRHFVLDSKHNDAGELVISYRTTKRVTLDYRTFEPGDTIQFILPTLDSIHAAVKSAQEIRGYCAGVVFFRWPSANETLAMQPAEVLAAAGLSSATADKNVSVHLVDGACAAVHCSDLYLVNAKLFFPSALRYRIRSSEELEYFLPEKGMPVAMSGAAELTVSLPPYSGRLRLYLGRAVTLAPSKYTVREGDGK